MKKTIKITVTDDQGVVLDMATIKVDVKETNLVVCTGTEPSLKTEVLGLQIGR